MPERMFPFITRDKNGKPHTWNPLGGECRHNCIYCWAKQLCKKYDMKKYHGEPRLIEKELHCKFKAGEFWFVQDMSDLFAENVPTRLILKVLDVIREHPETKFLLLTKNPKRYLEFIRDKEFSENVVLGATIETDSSSYYNSEYETYWEISQAPDPYERMQCFKTIRQLTSLPVFVSIEPILNFHLAGFLHQLAKINPWAVAVGYDNYGHKLPEPPLKKTQRLISNLQGAGITVYEKTLRPAWWEVEQS